MKVKAIRVYETGGVDKMKWEDVEVGEPGPGQLRIRHTAVAVNYRDILVRLGVHTVAKMPTGLGMDATGVVDAIGPGVEGFTIGQRVTCIAGPDGAYAEARLVPAARALALPDEIDDLTAGSMMIRGMTARYLIRDTYWVQPGDTILVHAAAGGLGLILCQWAKYIGATVVGTVSSEAKAEIARAHGCDHPIVHGKEDFVARTRELTNGEGVPVVYDSIGKDTFMGSLKCLRPRGLLASLGESSGEPDPIEPRRLGLMGSLYLTHPSLPHYTATREQLEAVAADLFDVVRRGIVRIEVNHVYPLMDAARAHQDMEARKTTGSVVLEV